MTMEIDVLERGAPKNGEPQTMDQRLFMQLQVFRNPKGTTTTEVLHALKQALQKHQSPAVVYEDCRDPRAFALLTWSQNPDHFVEASRRCWSEPVLCDVKPLADYAMFGRTYSSGYEPDLEYWLLRRPIETVTNPAWPWAIWYPLRRTGAFETLDKQEQRAILGEHAMIGRAYGEKNLAHDVRLACHGLDRDDNEFLIGLIGESLHPLSHVVQHMRSTKQTSRYIQAMGPFFVGKAVHTHMP